MNSSLRALSLVFASTALLLGPGQAIAGSWGDDKGSHGDDWGKGDDWDKGKDDWDKGDDWDKDDIFNVRACYDHDKREIRVKYDYRDNDWYNKHKDFYDNNQFVKMVISDGEAICEKNPGKGRGRGLRKVEKLDGYYDEEEACHTSGCGFEARFYLDDHVCTGNRTLCGAEIDYVVVEIDGHDACEVHVSDCHGGW